jgi:hypothetical protein
VEARPKAEALWPSVKCDRRRGTGDHAARRRGVRHDSYRSRLRAHEIVHSSSVKK